MTEDWKDYQDRTAAFFNSLGLRAETESLVCGARGRHKVDVLVSFERFGIKTVWIVECKLWKTSVPKDKVLTLQAIVQDVGADKGIILSESGFQAGAIACARSTSIILSDLATLKEIAAEEIAETRWGATRDRLDETMDRLRSMRWRERYRQSDRGGSLISYGPPGYVRIIGTLAIFENEIRRGRKGKRPLVCDFSNDGEPVRTNDVDEFFEHLESAIQRASEYCTKHKDFLPDR